MHRKDSAARSASKKRGHSNQRGADKENERLVASPTAATNYNPHHLFHKGNNSNIP